MVPILLGVMVITFLLFFVVNTPQQMARQTLGVKAPKQQLDQWLVNRGYAYPAAEPGGDPIPVPKFINTLSGKNPFDSLLVHTIRDLAMFRLGTSNATNEPIAEKLKRGMGPSLMITLPAFLLGTFLAIVISLFLVFLRESLLDRWGVAICVALMSIPITVYVIFCQWVASNSLSLFPAFGYNLEGFSTARFLALPVAVIVLSGVGGSVRLYRTIFLEEIRADFVRTAYAKGVSNSRVLFVHVLKNGMISIVTLVVAALPSLILGTLVVESFFGIPGLGDIMSTAIHTQDYPVIMADVYIGSVLYLIGLMLTDICYAAVDPRIRLQ